MLLKDVCRSCIVSNVDEGWDSRRDVAWDHSGSIVCPKRFRGQPESEAVRRRVPISVHSVPPPWCPSAEEHGDHSGGTCEAES